ncbi:MAG: serine protease [Pseudobdellovibrionaceae bacterium]
MKLRLNFILFTLAVLTGLTGHAISNGIPLSKNEYPAVVLIEDLGQKSIGTGVVIGNGTILTAEHCVFSKDPKKIRINGQAIVSKILVDSTATAATRLDLALLKVDPKSSKTTLPLAQFELPPPPFEVAIIGYGSAFKAGQPLEQDNRVVKRIGKNEISSPDFISDLYFNLEFEWEPFDKSKPSGALPGDSGGPMLLDETVIGIASKSTFLSNYVNLLGPRAQAFFKKAVSTGWKIDFVQSQ